MRRLHAARTARPWIDERMSLADQRMNPANVGEPNAEAVDLDDDNRACHPQRTADAKKFQAALLALLDNKDTR
jgi:hypothetical protein